MRIFTFGIVNKNKKKNFLKQLTMKCNYQLIDYDNFIINYTKGDVHNDILFSEANDEFHNIIERITETENTLIDSGYSSIDNNGQNDITIILSIFGNMGLGTSMKPTDKFILLYENFYDTLRFYMHNFSIHESNVTNIIALSNHIFNKQYDIFTTLPEFGSSPKIDISFDTFFTYLKRITSNDPKIFEMENKLKTKNVWNMRCNKIVNLDEFTGGSTDIYYNKYIKYKNKYMILKRSSNV